MDRLVFESPIFNSNEKASTDSPFQCTENQGKVNDLLLEENITFKRRRIFQLKEEWQKLEPLDRLSRRWLLDWPKNLSQANLLKRLTNTFEDVQWVIASKVEKLVYVALNTPTKLSDMEKCGIQVLARNVVDSVSAKHAKPKLGSTYQTIYLGEEEAEEIEENDDFKELKMKMEIQKSIKERAKKETEITSYWTDLIKQGISVENLKENIVPLKKGLDVKILFNHCSPMLQGLESYLKEKRGLKFEDEEDGEPRKKIKVLPFDVESEKSESASFQGEEEYQEILSSKDLNQINDENIARRRKSSRPLRQIPIPEIKSQKKTQKKKSEKKEEAAGKKILSSKINNENIAAKGTKKARSSRRPLLQISIPEIKSPKKKLEKKEETAEQKREKALFCFYRKDNKAFKAEQKEPEWIKHFEDWKEVIKGQKELENWSEFLLGKNYNPIAVFNFLKSGASVDEICVKYLGCKGDLPNKFLSIVEEFFRSRPWKIVNEEFFWIEK